ncbi:hypothetical protein SAMN05518849_13229 [Sphingobium sp. AP50]|uniref:hypothetical protein n=1 Tax=Sphingobium sp. AP50 TaxID=1884369 RepID=UPI0008D0E81A|nr:hypothetical protein [Sphingobium sp. AP50]SEK04161.1 hypothetical protein SAMN05518849_13229 [Sphingobium sp. AP50]
MPLWLDLLRTPMAAPETGKLRRLRYLWQSLCALTALCVGFITPLRQGIGGAAPCLAAAVIAATLIQSLIYWAAKQRADNASLNAGERPE